MRIASKTDVGKVRKVNQDDYATGELGDKIAYAVVCDGMGGANGGDMASSVAVRTISDKISKSYRPDMGSNSIRDMLKSAIYAANMQVFDLARTVESLSGMGTTVVAAFVCEGIAHVAHAGDSRAYLIRGKKITQITRDHSIVQSMLETGQLTPEEARFHPRKNVITRALGVDETIDIDYTEAVMDEESVLMICTDGLSNYLEPEEILAAVGDLEISKWPDRLVCVANEKGGGDNITVVVLAG